MMNHLRFCLWTLSLIGLLGGCASNPTQPEHPHVSITQEGQKLTPVSAGNGAYQYTLKNAAFSILVPNVNAQGEAQDAGHVPVLICASADPAILQGIATGMSIGQMPCLNGATAMARPLDETARGIDLMLSTGNGHNNIDDLHSVFGSGHNTVNVRRIADFKVVGHTCLSNGRCIDKREIVHYAGNAVYLIVFTDMNRNHIADPGEYTLLTLQLTPTNEDASDQVSGQSEADRFLTENAKRPEVTVTASGLQYEVLSLGSGPKPGPHDRAVINYRGTLTDGAEVSSSYSRGAPIDFPVDHVFPGLTEAFQLMPSGSRFRFYIPPGLAFGSRGAGKVGPNQVVVYEIELLRVGAP